MSKIYSSDEFICEWIQWGDGVGWFRPNIWSNLVLIEIRIRNKTRLWRYSVVLCKTFLVIFDDVIQGYISLQLNYVFFGFCSICIMSCLYFIIFAFVTLVSCLIGILLQLHYVPFAFCYICILSHLHFVTFVFCLICVLLQLHYVLSAFCYICNLSYLHFVIIALCLFYILS